MQTSETHTLDSKLERIGNILRLVGWIGFWVQLGFAAAAFLTLMFALTPISRVHICDQRRPIRI